MEMDERTLAISALTLVGATAEACADNGLANPMLYNSLTIAIRLATELGEPELITLLQSTQIAVGEGMEEITTMMNHIKERLDNLNADIYTWAEQANKEDN